VTESPRSAEDLDEQELESYLDLGGLLIHPAEGVELQVQADEATGTITQVTCVAGDGGMQLHAYAAPRSGGMWEEVRPQIRASITGSGGLVEDATGPFGPELKASVPGESGLAPARFVGIDGPRWFLRAVFIGSAARPGPSSETLEGVLRGTVVRRGDHAMPLGTALSLRLPGMTSPTEAVGRPVITLPKRGPEITEIR
jgi:hypothetical protein